MAKCGEVSLAKEQLQAANLQVSTCQNESSRLSEKLAQLESVLKEQEQYGKQGLVQEGRPLCCSSSALCAQTIYCFAHPTSLASDAAMVVRQASSWSRSYDRSCVLMSA